MAKIPILKTNYRTLTQVFPVVPLDSNGAPAVDRNGNRLNKDMSHRTDLYIDMNTVIGVSKYFDDSSERFRNGFSQLTIVGVSVPVIPIVVTENYGTIKGYMNDRENCNELCEDN